MPKEFEKEGYRFFFYSNEHLPIHVHVRYGSGEAVFNVDSVVELRESVGLKVRELSRPEELAWAHQALIIQKCMNTLTDTAQSARLEGSSIVVLLHSGAEVRFPVAENSRLSGGTQSQLSNIEISPCGLHWPDLDEDLSLGGLLRGEHGQRARASRQGLT